MDLDWQQLAAGAIVCLTILLFARRLIRRRKGGCRCSAVPPRPPGSARS